jgi:hypothetical protein
LGAIPVVPSVDRVAKQKQVAPATLLRLLPYQATFALSTTVPRRWSWALQFRQAMQHRIMRPVGRLGGMVGGVEGDAAQAGELRLDAVIQLA